MKQWLLFFLCLFVVSNAIAGSAFLYFSDVMRQPSYKKAWQNMIRGKRLPNWLYKIGQGEESYVSGPVIPILLNDNLYQCFPICKPHLCGYEYMKILVSPNHTQAWSLLIEENKQPRWLGNPNDALKKALLDCAEN